MGSKVEEKKEHLFHKIKSKIYANPLLFILSLLFLTGIVALISVFTAYFLVFDGSISKEHDKWGMFGDFIGGTLNPILAFLSFFALLFTIWFQSKELKISNETLKDTKNELEQARKIASSQAEAYKVEAEKATLLKSIESVHAEIKELYYKRVDFCPDKNNMGWFFSNSAPSSSASIIPKNGDQVSQNDRILLADITQYISELSGYLDEFITKYGASSITYFYQSRYLNAKTRLVNNGFLIDQVLKGFSLIRYGWSAVVKDN